MLCSSSLGSFCLWRSRQPQLPRLAPQGRWGTPRGAAALRASALCLSGPREGQGCPTCPLAQQCLTSLPTAGHEAHYLCRCVGQCHKHSNRGCSLGRRAICAHPGWCKKRHPNRRVSFPPVAPLLTHLVRQAPFGPLWHHRARTGHRIGCYTSLPARPGHRSHRLAVLPAAWGFRLRFCTVAPPSPVVAHRSELNLSISEDDATLPSAS